MATLNYRFASPDDVPAAVQLVRHSFPGPSRPPEWWSEQLRDPRHGGGPEVLFLGEDAGRIVAGLQLHRFQQWISGEAMPCAGVGTVTIAPTHRKRGLAAELMTMALRAARERGDIVSALYPFRTSFYRKLGYGNADEALQYQVPPEVLPDSEERLRVELLQSDESRAEALRLFNDWAATQTGQMVREARVWDHLCTMPDRGLVGYRAASGALEGYALVFYRADLPPQNRFLEVEELVWTSTAARRGLYAWLASLGDQWQQILIRALPSQRLGDWIREPRLPWGAAPTWSLWNPAATLLMGTMFRLVDVEGALARRRIATTISLSFTVQLRDTAIAENDGAWRVTMEAGRVRLERSAAGDADLSLDVSTLSRLFIASLPATAALEARLLECSRPELLPALDTALALPEPWTFHRF